LSRSERNGRCASEIHFRLRSWILNIDARLAYQLADLQRGVSRDKSLSREPEARIPVNTVDVLPELIIEGISMTRAVVYCGASAGQTTGSDNNQHAGLASMSLDQPELS
jgi:hypothetical protein